MVTLKLIAEYGCWPVWEVTAGGRLENLDPSSMPISAALAEELINWAEAFDNTLVYDYPPWPGFADRHAALAWRQLGATLASRLQAELGANRCQVVYEGS